MENTKNLIGSSSSGVSNVTTPLVSASPLCLEEGPAFSLSSATKRRRGALITESVEGDVELGGTAT